MNRPSEGEVNQTFIFIIKIDEYIRYNVYTIYNVRNWFAYCKRMGKPQKISYTRYVLYYFYDSIIFGCNTFDE